MTINRESLAWAAGLFEGEGSACCNLTQQRRRFCLQLTMTDESVIRKFHRVVGVGRVYGPFTKKKSNWSPSWSWNTTTFESAQFVAVVLWTWLEPRRKAQIKQAFQRYFAHPAQGRRWFKMPDERLTPDQVREIRARCIEGETQTEIAKIFKRSQSTISRIVGFTRQAGVQ